MTEEDCWIYFDGPEPERLRPLLDAMRAPSGAGDGDKAGRVQRLLARLDALHAPAPAPPPRAAQLREQPPDPVADPLPSPPPLPPVVPAPPALVGTAPLALPEGVRDQLAALPFVPPRAPTGREPARTMKVPVMTRGLGGTLPVGDDSIARAVATLPFAGEAATAAVVLVPRLSLETYASLCAELAVTPDRAAEIRVKYQVPSEASQRALDEAWRGWLAEQPRERAAFEATVTAYAAWLRLQRR